VQGLKAAVTPKSDHEAAALDGEARTCGTCRHLVRDGIEDDKQPAAERCRLYRAGKWPMSTAVAMSSPKRCGSGRGSWAAPATEEELSKTAEGIARVLAAGGVNARLMKLLQHRRD